MKNILLHINDDDGAEQRLQAALDLARAHQAHLTCLQTTPFTAFVASDGFGGVFVMSSVLDAVEKRERELRDSTESRLQRENVTWTYVHSDGEPARTVVACSRLADLIILSRTVRQPKINHPQPLAADVATSARAPVLAIPPGGKRFDAVGRALVAWNGSPEAANALKAALPMLRQSFAVDVVAVSRVDTSFPATDACQYLSRHGIHAEHHPVELDGATIAEALVQAAACLGSAYIVMGAYGHSRAREFLLGGVTRQMLSDSPLPLLMTH